jgi:RNA polymerase sigma-70 factor (ECF subfamily)
VIVAELGHLERGGAEVVGSPVVLPTTGTEELDGLMRRLADGDRSAFTPMFKRLWPEVRKLCGALLVNTADADDAAQQAMEKILSRCAEYDVTRPAKPWALGIAAWECRTLRKKRQRRRETTDERLDRGASAGHEEELVQRDLVRNALLAIETLSATDRETLLATFWEDEAAPGVSGATLRKRRERALTRLRDAMRRLYGLD